MVDANRQIFATTLRLARKNYEIDMLEVIAQLEADNELKGAGGYDYILDFENSPSYMENIDLNPDISVLKKRC